MKIRIYSSTIFSPKEDFFTHGPFFLQFVQCFLIGFFDGGTHMQCAAVTRWVLVSSAPVQMYSGLAPL